MTEGVQVPCDMWNFHTSINQTEAFEFLCLSEYLSQWYMSFFLYALESNPNQYAPPPRRGGETGWMEDRGNRGIFHCILFLKLSIWAVWTYDLVKIKLIEKY